MDIFSGKKQLNLIIGFDTINYNLKIMRVLSRDVHSVKVDFVSVNQDYFIRGEWEKILAEGLPEYMSKQSFDQSFAVHLVLPDGVIGADVFNVPTLKRAKMETALETSLKDLYFFYNDYKFNKAIVSSNKTNTTFEVIMASKSLLNRVYKSLNELKLYVKNATFAANATVNAALALRPKNKKQSFIMLDIDFFKKINDTWGHSVGDEVLVNLSKLIRSRIRTTDALVRWGGEEFVILCSDTPLQNAQFLAEKLRVNVENTQLISQQQITCSFGVAEMLPHEDPKIVFEHLDKALYSSKRGGRNSVTAAIKKI